MSIYLTWRNGNIQVENFETGFEQIEFRVRRWLGLLLWHLGESGWEVFSPPRVI